METVLWWALAAYVASAVNLIGSACFDRASRRRLGQMRAALAAWDDTKQAIENATSHNRSTAAALAKGAALWRYGAFDEALAVWHAAGVTVETQIAGRARLGFETHALREQK